MPVSLHDGQERPDVFRVRTHDFSVAEVSIIGFLGMRNRAMEKLPALPRRLVLEEINAARIVFDLV